MVDAKSSHWSLKAMYACLGIAIVGAVFTFSGGGSGAIQERAYVCMECGEITNMQAEQLKEIIHQKNVEYVEKMEEANPQMGALLRQALEDPASILPHMRMAARFPSWGSANFPLTCPACGQDALVEAYNCPKCKKPFCAYKKDGSYDDTCPHCGYSLKAELKKK